MILRLIKELNLGEGNGVQVTRERFLELRVESLTDLRRWTEGSL